MADIDAVVAALGITRQAYGVGYWDVDQQVNAKLLEEALRSILHQFALLHVLNGECMEHVPLIAAKSAFVRQL